MDNGPWYRASVEILALVQFTRLRMNIQKTNYIDLKLFMNIMIHLKISPGNCMFQKP